MKRVLRSSVAVLAGAAMVAAGAVLVPRALRSAPTPSVSVPIPATEGIVLSGSLDSTIASLQERLRSTDDPRSLASLGIAYLQKARSVADPTYYAKSEDALRRSLAMDAEDNFDAAIGMARRRSAWSATRSWSSAATRPRRARTERWSSFGRVSPPTRASPTRASFEET